MKSKTRRKMTFRRFAYYLLITAIVASCVTNGIFAKFTTEDDGGDGARVAKFGIVLSVAGDLFSTTYNEYAEDNAGNETANSNMPAVFTEVDTDDGISVQAHFKYVQNGEEVSAENLNTSADYSFNNVVAPGTKNDEGINISIQGTAETDCVIEYKVDMETVFLRTGIPNDYELIDGYYYSYNPQKPDLPNINYCVMVPMKENIIREDNFEEFKDTLYTASTVGGATTYTKVNGNFDSTADYFQAEDVIETISNDYYMPIVYYIEGTSSMVEDMKDGITVDKWKDSNIFPIPYPFQYEEFSQSGTSQKLEFFTKGIIGYALTGQEPLFEGDGDTPLQPNDVNPYKPTSSEGKSAIIETGTELDIDLDLKWYWDFVKVVDNKEVSYANGCDTILGHLMNDKLTKQKTVFKTLNGGETYIEPVEGVDYNLNVDFDIDITINQVD